MRRAVLPHLHGDASRLHPVVRIPGDVLAGVRVPDAVLIHQADVVAAVRRVVAEVVVRSHVGAADARDVHQLRIGTKRRQPVLLADRVDARIGLHLGVRLGSAGGEERQRGDADQREQRQAQKSAELSSAGHAAASLS